MRYYFLLLLMLLSGLAGISYEILYARLLGNIIGDQFIVSASILMTFLLGIGWGSLVAHRFWRYLWLVELGIGFYAWFMVAAQPWFESFIYGEIIALPAGLAGSVLVCVILLCLPAALIGCSVPLFSSYLDRQKSAGNIAFSQVYMVYNIGAALTALAIEFFLIRWLGIETTVQAFAAMNVIIGFGLWLSCRDLSENKEHQHASSLYNTVASVGWQRAWPLIVASVASAVFQLFMLKYAEMLFGPFRESFALVLSIVLLGIVLGSLLVRYTAARFTTLMWLALAGILWMLLAGGAAIYFYAAIYDLINIGYTWMVVGKWFLLASLMLLPATAFGATIPALLLHKKEVGEESGSLLFISSCANAAGFLLMVFVLHPLLDYGVQLLVVFCLSSLALLLGMLLKPSGLTWRITTAVLLALVLAGGIFKYQWDEDLLYLSYTNYHDVETTREKREKVSFPDRYKGYQDVFSINWINGKPYFFINGYISIPLNNSSEKVVGALSSLYAPNLGKALVLGLGSGATSSSVGLFFEHTEVVEINPVVRDNLFRMSRWNYDIEHNERVSIIVDDAIHHIKSHQGRYALILNTVTTPLYFSSSKLYTTDFLSAVKARLETGGVYVTWMDSRIGDVGADIVLRSMKKQFKHCALLYIKSAYFLLVCSDQPIRATQTAQVVNNPILKHDMMARYGIVTDWLPYQLLTTDAYRLIGDPIGAVNSADHPVLEYEMAHLQETGIAKLKRRLVTEMSIDDIRQSLAGRVPEAFPADAVLHARKRMKKSMLYRRLDHLALQDVNSQQKKKLAILARRKVRADVLKTVRDQHQYGYQLMQVSRYKEAVKAFDLVLKLDPKYNDSHFNRAVSLEHLGRIDEAAQAYTMELQVDPQDLDALYRLGRLWFQEKQYRRSLAQFNRALSFNNRGGVARNLFFYRSLAFKAIGEKKKSADSMRQYLDLGGIKRLDANVLLGDNL